VLLKKLSGAVDAIAGGLEEVADGVRFRAWVDTGLGASGPGSGGFSGIADWIRSGKFNVPCGMYDPQKSFTGWKNSISA
jgi:hypothetical protein